MDLLLVLAVHVGLMLAGLRLMIDLVPSPTVRGWLDRLLRLLARAVGRATLFGLRQLHHLLLRGVERGAGRIRRRLDRGG